MELIIAFTFPGFKEINRNDTLKPFSAMSGRYHLPKKWLLLLIILMCSLELLTPLPGSLPGPPGWIYPSGSYIRVLTTLGCHYLGMVCKPGKGRAVTVMVTSGSPGLPSTGLCTDQVPC